MSRRDININGAVVVQRAIVDSGGTPTPSPPRTIPWLVAGLRRLTSPTPYLLIKSPPASGKSRALMFVALDTLRHQGLKQAINLAAKQGVAAMPKTQECQDRQVGRMP